MNINFKESTIYLLFKINIAMNIPQNYLSFKIKKEKKDNLLKKQKHEKQELTCDMTFLFSHKYLFCFYTGLAK